MFWLSLKRAILFFVALNFCSCKPSSNTAKVQELKSTFDVNVLSFNIRYGTADDGPNRWEMRRDAVFKKIVAKQFDFVLLQEVMSFQLEQILASQASQKPYRAIYRTREKQQGTGEGVPILYNHKVWKLAESGTFWLSDTPQKPGSVSWKNTGNIPRIATWGLFEKLNDTKKMLVFNTHYDFNNDSGQTKSSELILRMVQKYNLPTIIGGDFNMKEGSPAYQPFQKSKFVDSWRSLHRESLATYHAFRGSTEGDRIDFIFASSPHFLVIDSQIDTSSSEAGRFPSDHFPISAQLQMVGR